MNATLAEYRQTQRTRVDDIIAAAARVAYNIEDVDAAVHASLTSPYRPHVVVKTYDLAALFHCEKPLVYALESATETGTDELVFDLNFTSAVSTPGAKLITHVMPRVAAVKDDLERVSSVVADQFEVALHWGKCDPQQRMLTVNLVVVVRTRV
jgi:hypothetical protein